MKRIVTLAVGVVLALALLVPSLALASGSSSCQTYNPQNCTPNNTTTGVPESTTATVSSQTLPFTGLDVALLVVGGGVLLGAGLVVRRASRHLG
jgi:hypothetical protein